MLLLLLNKICFFGIESICINIIIIIIVIIIIIINSTFSPMTLFIRRT
jgi:hypothetical protein